MRHNNNRRIRYTSADDEAPSWTGSYADEWPTLQ
ncbi:hypothetical protein FBY50_1240 [Zymomonas mobilis]|uniref:Uncharacterized protein n=1 Tax=Zymomonas mobilis subsp. mobilis (strain ATCC 10988 / DSM 424 / LMG 404 / NCIMB 8938 / NRRL B-806 / ZM1) TaxID=555217 RepID=A0A0H3G2R7_ZYMMA|nr:hypothetical protein Zmob_1262 [Zymomonas mobilis subsp. mobilis ATCC 10988]AHJ70874.1 hypothetical protein A254_01263 [Zymomonas mobilis subsp. mobilis NRRL B-12526]TQL27302.1 hypothetical protein FBY55_0613 [Zymomonas mobilis]TWD60420.1 hypothetical protein FBY50_1240 [Zymomonas mobilis]TWE24924.1 hypothetical protein FBY52_10738 [Zymomonas mobilis]